MRHGTDHVSHGRSIALVSIPAPVERTVAISRTVDGDVVPTAAVRARLRAADQDPVLAWVATLAVTGIALFLRLWDLGKPHKFLFDETYYAKDAWSLLHHGYALTYVENANERILAGRTADLWTETPNMVVHPEVGKWLIALGEGAFGMTPFGWRISSAIAGALMVMVMIRLARRVTRSTLLGLVAGLLMCFDGLHLVLSRLGLLDLFLAFFVLCAVSCMVADRDWVRARMARALPPGSRLAPGSWGPLLLWRPWRLATGICWGLAVGTKWSALFPLAAFGLLMWFWDSGARRSFGVRHALWKSAVIDALPALSYVVLVPLLVYVASWTGWLLHADVYERALSDTQYGPYWGSYLEKDARGFFSELWQSLRSLWHYHHDVYVFHTGFLNDSTHVYQSKPWGWLLLNRPVGVDAQLDIQPGAQGCAAAAGSTCLRQVLLLGNPMVWWFGTIAAVWAAVSWLARRDWRYGLVTIGIAVTWLPWMRYDDRPIFSYYAVVILPFIVLGATLFLGEILGRRDASSSRRSAGAAVAGSVVVLTIMAFGWFWPIWTDQLITNGEWLQRMWFKRWV